MPEARDYLNGLKTGAISAELTEEERKWYELFREVAHEEGSEKEYLMGTLEGLIAIEEHRERIKNN